MRSFVLLSSLVIVACGGGATKGGGPDAAVDAHAIVIVDGGPDYAGVACGLTPTTTCRGGDPDCCASNASDTCVASTAVCNGERMQCDGPEDCAANEDCCFISTHGAACTERGMCGNGDLVMCHPGESTCGAGLMCCDIGPGPTTSPYGVCRAICPG